MTNALLVFAGGGAGALLRYLATLAIGGPVATLLVNVIGSFLIGVAAATLPDTGSARLLLMTGLLGGFTTFSAFSMDVVALAGRGAIGAAILYATASVLLSLVAAAAGFATGS